MLESKEIVMSFNGKLAVNGVSLQMEPGHVYAMLGPNGSGKTTWMKLAVGLLKPTAGEMLWNGAPVGIGSRREIAYMPTEPYFYGWMRVRDVGRYYADFFEDFRPEKFAELLERMELTPEMKVKTLSSGMTAKLKVAAALARHARVYLLDEPFNGIDLLARDQIAKAIVEAADAETVLALSSHLVEELETLADRVVFLSEGKLIESADVEEMRERTGLSLADRYRKIYGLPETGKEALA